MASSPALRDSIRVEEIGRELGRGAYGIVYEVKVGGQLCAGKKISTENDPMCLLQFKKDCHRHSLKLSHPNIVECIGFYYTGESSVLPMLVMEYLPMSSEDCLEDLPLKLKHSILQDVADGLHYLHHIKRIIHCDVSLDNIMLTSNYLAKLGDFGSSVMIDDDKPRTKKPGPRAIMPPEAFADDPKYDEKLDVFSYGCLIISILSHKWPWPIAPPQYVEDGIEILVSEWDRRSMYTRLIPSDNPLLPLAKKCLQNDPHSRPTIIGAKEYIITIIKRT